MGNPDRVVPGMQNVTGNFGNPDPVFHLGKDERSISPHFPGVTLHHCQIRPDGRRQIGLIDDQEVRLGQAGPTLSRYFVAPGDINHLNGEIRQFPAETGRKIIAARFQKEQLRVKFFVKLLQGHKIRRDVLTNGCMGASTGFDRPNSSGLQGLMLLEEFAILPGKNVIGHRCQADLVAKLPTELQHERGFAAAHRSSHSDGKGPLVKVAVQGSVPVMKVPGMLQMLMRVPVLVPVPVSVRVGVRMGMGMRVH